MKSNCKGCTKRYVGCHDKCEDYQAYRKEVDERKEQKYQYFQKEGIANTLAKERSRRRCKAKVATIKNGSSWKGV